MKRVLTGGLQEINVTPVLLVTMVIHVVMQLIFLFYFMHFGNQAWQSKLH